jgi:hypothetical protein
MEYWWLFGRQVRAKKYRAAALILDVGVFNFGHALHSQLPSFLQYLIHHHWDTAAITLLKLRHLPQIHLAPPNTS